jgi:hypothetical protein
MSSQPSQTICRSTRASDSVSSSRRRQWPNCKPWGNRRQFWVQIVNPEATTNVTGWAVLTYQLPGNASSTALRVPDAPLLPVTHASERMARIYVSQPRYSWVWRSPDTVRSDSTCNNHIVATDQSWYERATGRRTLRCLLVRQASSRT